MKIRNKIQNAMISAALALTIVLPISVNAESAAILYEVDSSYTDQQSQVTLYSISYQEGNQYRNRIVAEQSDGSWVKWQESFYAFHNDNDDRIRVFSSDYQHNLFATYRYDSDRQAIVKGNLYNLSPDDKWGWLERKYYKTVSNDRGQIKMRDYYMKNMETGDIKVFKSSERGTILFWYGDHQLLMGTYNTQAKQNEIGTYDPSADRWKSLLLGSLYNFNQDHGHLLYVKNEPMRKPWVYDMNIRSSRLLQGEWERQLLFPWSTNTSEPEPALPNDFNLGEIPEVQVSVEQQYEHQVEINDQKISVPDAFYKGGTLWIPVRPLMETLHWKLEVVYARQYHYKYALSHGNARIVLTPENSQSVYYRLYMTRGELQSLGYGKVHVTANMN